MTTSQECRAWACSDTSAVPAAVAVGMPAALPGKQPESSCGCRALKAAACWLQHLAPCISRALMDILLLLLVVL